MKKLLSIIAMTALTLTTGAQSWPTPTTEAKPGTRWWWLGSAVDKSNLQWNLHEYASHGIGAVEITPIYGVQGNDARNIPYLSDQWMEMLRYTQQQAAREGIEVDMATGTGWPFGGPWVPLKESACRAVFVERTCTADDAVVDLTPSAQDTKNAFLHKVMLYTADGTAIDVTTHVNDGKLALDNLSLPSAPNSSLPSTPNSSLLTPNPYKVLALYIKYGVMKVKRAAPGGEGLVIDHFDRQAVAH